MSRGEEFFHGTTAHLKVGAVIAPGRKPNYAGESSPEHAYATTSEEHGWDYAEKAWHASDKGHPRVYQVAPIGEVEKDPTEYETGSMAGRSRGNYDTDVRSRQGFKVLSERQMPEHMGTPEDWK